MSARELLGEPDRLAFLLLIGLVLLVLGLGAIRHRRAATEPASEPVTTWPYLVRLELLGALATLLVVSWWAIGLPLPLGPAADPTVTPAIAKAPWFFVGIQELLQYFDPWLAGTTLPAIGLLGLAALPYLDRDPTDAGRYRLRPAALIALAGLLALWLVPTGIGLWLRGENWSFSPIWREPVPLDEPLAPVLSSLGEKLHLGRVGQQLLGAGLCVGPFLLLALLWPRLRRRPALSRLGFVRYLVAGGLLLVLVGVGLKVLLVVGLEVRYLWVTPWFRI